MGNPWGRIVTGLGIAVVGGVLTLGTQIFAVASGGERYFIFWGAVAVGLWMVATGALRLPGYYMARRSADPWRQAQYDEVVLCRLVARGLRDGDVAEQRRAAAHLAPVGLLEPQVSAPVFVWALTSDDDEVRGLAVASIRAVLDREEQTGRTLLSHIMNVFETQPPENERWPRMYEVLTVLRNPGVFAHWRRTGEFKPELTHPDQAERDKQYQQAVAELFAAHDDKAR